METKVLENRKERILGLSPRQALAITQYVTASLAERRVDPQDFESGDQIQILNAAFEQEGYPAVLPAEIAVSEEAAGQAAQEFLLLLAAAGDDALLAELDEWLAEPPEAAIAAIPLVLAAPIVLTGCVVALQTGVVVERSRSGKWKMHIEKRPLAGKTLKEIVGGLFDIVRILPAQ